MGRQTDCLPQGLPYAVGNGLGRNKGLVGLREGRHEQVGGN